MAGTGDTIKLYLTLDNKGAIRALSETGDKASSTSSKIEESNRRTSESFGHVHHHIGLLAGAVGLGAVGAFGALAVGIVDVTKAGIGMQAQQAQLQNALRNTGVTGRAAFAQMTAAANDMATRGGFAAAENVQSLTQLTRVTGNATAATKLFALATDVARGSHKDLLQVTKAVALAEQGRTTGLSRMGIVLPKGTTPVCGDANAPIPVRRRSERVQSLCCRLDVQPFPGLGCDQGRPR